MLRVINLSFSYGDIKVLNQISFNVFKGDIVSITGKSGVGKTTLLSLIFGYLEPDNGECYWQNQKIKPPSEVLLPGKKGINFLSQELDLMPYTTVFSNISKKLSRAIPEENQKRCDELLAVVNLLDFKDVLVKNLSGGQKRRVAIAQVLADKPELLLLDEPFNFIDYQIKDPLRRSFFQYLKSNEITCVFVSHESQEFLAFTEQIIVLNDKKIMKNTSPQQLYEQPERKIIAKLLDDVNIIQLEDKSNAVAVYPHELQVSNQTSNKTFDVKLTNIYYQGYNFLNRGVDKHQKNYMFLSNQRLDINRTYHLKVSNRMALKRFVI
jgi:ABC-type sulfate/molybdate transport systems ATPase subunit